MNIKEAFEQAVTASVSVSASGACAGAQGIRGYLMQKKGKLTYTYCLTLLALIIEGVRPFDSAPRTLQQAYKPLVEQGFVTPLQFAEVYESLTEQGIVEPRSNARNAFMSFSKHFEDDTDKLKGLGLSGLVKGALVSPDTRKALSK